MPSYNRPGHNSEFKFIKECGLTMEFTHLPSGRKARFIGALTNFQDAYTSKWNAEEVYGRMDPIATFQRTGRVISMSWTILNESAEIGEDNMREVSKLINFLYPTYATQTGGASTIQTAPLLKFRFANLVNSVANRQEGLVGYLSGFTVTPNLDAGYVKNSKKDTIFQELNAVIEFTVLHTHKLGWAGDKPRQRNFPYGKTGLGQAVERVQGGSSDAGFLEEGDLQITPSPNDARRLRVQVSDDVVLDRLKFGEAQGQLAVAQAEALLGPIKK
tara:strand:- start:1563 stop:2381 length:819 start_codon:yes stop_codon:yes gene_type:complete